MAAPDGKGKPTSRGDRDYSTFLTFRAPVELAERLDAVAVERGQSRSDYLRELVERAVVRAEARAGAA